MSIIIASISIISRSANIGTEKFHAHGHNIMISPFSQNIHAHKLTPTISAKTLLPKLPENNSLKTLKKLQDGPSRMSLAKPLDSPF